jgi:hypothetical protein
VHGLAVRSSGLSYAVYGRSESFEGYAGYFVGKGPDAVRIQNIGTGRGLHIGSAVDTALFANTTSGFAAVDGRNASSSGRAVYGAATATTGTTYGVYGETNSTSGFGVYGLANANSGVNYGVVGRSNSPSGRGVAGFGTATTGISLGVYGESASTSGRAVMGWASATSGSTHGVYGESNSTAGTGVAGYATATSGVAHGVSGISFSTSGKGVYGFANATSGMNYGGWFESASTSGVGVRGFATATSGTTYGVWGQSNSTSGYGVYSAGRFIATGTKSFQIDHPLHPETHFLNHFCTEGPDPYNVYRGNVTTDANGYATITLPPYFESINRDPTYHLTVIDNSDDFVLAKVVRKIQNNQFVIRTSKPYVEVSWRVEAIRNDRWVQEYGYQTEQEKPKESQGKYLNPELFGQPKERGIFYTPEPERPREGEKPQ